MKKWNEPELEELNINETASGIFDVGYEFAIIFRDGNSTPDEQS